MHPKFYWQLAVHARRKETAGLPPRTPPPIWDRTYIKKLLSRYFEETSDKLLELLEENKINLEHLEQIKHTNVGWITALLEFEEGLRAGKNVEEILSKLTGLVPRRSIARAEEILLEQYPSLDYLCDKCYIEKQILAESRRKELVQKEIAFERALSPELKDLINEYKEILSLERKYWFAKSRMRSLKRMANIIEKTKVVWDVLVYDGIPIRSFTQIDNAFEHLTRKFGESISLYYHRVRSHVLDELKRAKAAIEQYNGVEGRKRKVESQLYAKLKQAGLVPPAGELRNLYFKYESAYFIF